MPYGPEDKFLIIGYVPKTMRLIYCRQNKCIVMHLSIASPAPGDPGHGGDHAGTVRERTKTVARLCRGV